MTKQQQEKQLRYDKAYMRMAMEWAKLSYSQRKQVGAIMVKDRLMVIMVRLLVLIIVVKMKRAIPIGLYCTLRQML